MKRSTYAKCISALVSAAIASLAYAFRSDQMVAITMIGIAGTVLGKEFLRHTAD